MTRFLKLSFITLLFPLVFSSGCAAIAIALLGAGASLATGKAISYTMNGIAYRTFTASLPRVRRATLTALDRMGIKVEAKETNDQGESFKASGAGREIEVALEIVSPNSTRMRTIAKQGTFFVDRATAVEIIAQTENVLRGT